MRLPDISPARRRLSIALGVSLLLHVWLMEGRYGKGAAPGSAGGMPMAVRIQQALDAPLRLPFEPVVTGVARSETPAFITAAYPSGNAALNSSVSEAPAHSVTATAAALTQASDATYYAAGDLDVFPSALVKPDLSAALGAIPVPSTGKVRATVLIDEAGVVNAVRGVDAAAGDIEIVVRELLLRTRFTPARNKDGRIVKAQVLVALDYDTRSASAAR